MAYLQNLSTQVLKTCSITCALRSGVLHNKPFVALAGAAFVGSVEVDNLPGSPRSTPRINPSQGMLNQDQDRSTMEAPSMLPQEPHSLVPSEGQGMLPQSEGGPNMYPPPYMGMSGMGSAGFSSQQYAPPQLGSLFPPSQAQSSSAPGKSHLQSMRPCSSPCHPDILVVRDGVPELTLSNAGRSLSDIDISLCLT